MMLLNCCIQYANKFDKLGSGHWKTGKSQFSFQSQRRAMPKNVQVAVQLHPITSKLMLKIFKLDFKNTWTENFQMYKLDLEKAEEPEIKLPISIGSSKKQESSINHLFLFYWLCQSLWLNGPQQTLENSWRDVNTRPPDLPLEKSVCRSWSNS